MSVYSTVVAWRHAMESVLTIGPALSDVQWLAPTECPHWTVKDVYAHLIGGERWMAAGHPPVDQDLSSWTDGPVRERRDAPATSVLEELRHVYEQRRVQLGAGVDQEQPARLPMGQQSDLGMLLRTRAMDVWAHEQDIRRAVGMPGSLDSPAAAVAGQLFVAALPRIVAKSAQAPPGSVVRLATTGPVALDVAAAVDSSGRGSAVSPEPPVTAHVTLGWEAYTRLSCGRGDRADYEVTIAGDAALAERVLAHLAVTP